MDIDARLERIAFTRLNAACTYVADEVAKWETNRAIASTIISFASIEKSILSKD
jgi:hypothetical protein